MCRPSLLILKKKRKKLEKTLNWHGMNSMKLGESGMPPCYPVPYLLTLFARTELFSQAYEHISNSIDKVYKDLTKGKAAPMGGVAYLSLEETEVCL